MAGVLETIKSYLGDDDYVSPEEVTDGRPLPSGEYLLQEIKASGMAGDVVWEGRLEFDEEP